MIDNLKYTISSMSAPIALAGLQLPTNGSIEYEIEICKAKEGWKIHYISTPN